MVTSRKSPATRPGAAVGAKAGPISPPVKAARKPRPLALSPKVTKPAVALLVKALAPDIPEKEAKVKKPKLLRDSFTIPKAEYAVLGDLKARAAKLALPVKKSELLRAGIKALALMTDTALVAALGQVPTIKTGRPKSGQD